MITPKKIQNRLQLISEFYEAPKDALFDQKIIAAVRDCSLATVERDRWAGTGIKFIKIGRSIRYRKTDILAWLNLHKSLTSTSEIGEGSPK